MKAASLTPDGREQRRSHARLRFSEVGARQIAAGLDCGS
jgi:hypothetical protein